MGVVIEYAGQQGEPKWIAPIKSKWDYRIFGTQASIPEPDVRFEMLFEEAPGNRVDLKTLYVIAGKSVFKVRTEVERTRR